MSSKINDSRLRKLPLYSSNQTSSRVIELQLLTFCFRITVNPLFGLASIGKLKELKDGEIVGG